MEQDCVYRPRNDISIHFMSGSTDLVANAKYAASYFIFLLFHSWMTSMIYLNPIFPRGPVCSGLSLPVLFCSSLTLFLISSFTSSHCSVSLHFPHLTCTTSTNPLPSIYSPAHTHTTSLPGSVCGSVGSSCQFTAFTPRVVFPCMTIVCVSFRDSLRLCKFCSLFALFWDFEICTCGFSVILTLLTSHVWPLQ